MLQEHATSFEIPYPGKHGALHKCSSFVILDTPHPERLVESDLLGKPLFGEISGRIVVGVGEKMHHWASRFDIVLQMSHEMRPVSLHLLVGRDGAKNDFSKPAIPEFSKGYSADDLQRHFDDGERQMSAVVNETRDVVLGHFRKLLLEQAFETCQDDHALSGAIVVDDSELDLTVSFLYNCGLLNS